MTELGGKGGTTWTQLGGTTGTQLGGGGTSGTELWGGRWGYNWD